MINDSLAENLKITPQRIEELQKVTEELITKEQDISKLINLVEWEDNFTGKEKLFVIYQIGVLAGRLLEKTETLETKAKEVIGELLKELYIDTKDIDDIS
jgi:16S rRNA G527 N7-methylase RsmG